MDFWMRKMEERRGRRCFLKNGNTFLKELIADCNGISTPIRMFSVSQIYDVVRHVNPSNRVRGSQVICFSCVTEGRSYTIKVYGGQEKMAYNDIVLSARVSNHSGFLKLIGCCLEFPLPLLVFEDLDYKVLNHRGAVGSMDAPLLPWKVRLRIVKEVATAITYLHTAFPRIIIHLNICPSSVFLDKNWRPKLTGLALAVTLPEGKSSIKSILVENLGHIDLSYTDPCYFLTDVVTEYTDVYSFGVLMLVLLLGRSAVLLKSDGKFDPSTGIVDYVKDLQERGEPVVFGGDSSDMNPVQMKMLLDLALRCCEDENEDRPKMIAVAKEIKLIEKGSFDCSEMIENVSEDGQITH